MTPKPSNMIETVHPVLGIGYVELQTRLGITTDILGLSLLIMIVVALFYRVTRKKKSSSHKKIILSLLVLFVLTKGAEFVMGTTGANTTFYHPTVYGQLHIQKIEYPNKNSLRMSLQFIPDDPANFLIANKARNSVYTLINYQYLKLKYSLAFQKFKPTPKIISTISINCRDIQRDRLKNAFANQGLRENLTILNSKIFFNEDYSFYTDPIQIDTIYPLLPKHHACNIELNNTDGG
jgi:hypothetical protein